MSIWRWLDRRLCMSTINANGVTYYYERHGAGEPLLLLHGGLGSIDMFRDLVLPALAQSREVIAVDLHGHGRTRLGDRAISITDMGDDMAALLETLGLPQVDAMGYSLGAGVAFRLAAQHPARVRRLVLVSAGFAQAGFFPEMLPMQSALSAALAPMMKDTPMYRSYVAVAPEPSEFPKLLDRMGELMRQPYDWADDVKRVGASATEVMIVCGDSDMFRLEHIVEMYTLLGGGRCDAGWQREHQAKHRLAILPNVTHYDMFLSPALVPTVFPFLAGSRDTRSWAAPGSRGGAAISDRED
jgi:pimeloyl-ACP methyl ester carboxylesterase